MGAMLNDFTEDTVKFSCVVSHFYFGNFIAQNAYRPLIEKVKNTSLK